MLPKPGSGRPPPCRRRTTGTLEPSRCWPWRSLATSSKHRSSPTIWQNGFPQDTIAQFNYLPAIRAAIALGEKSPPKAIAALQAASLYELGTPALLIFVDLYPVYVRGQAYLGTRQGVAAAAEFQKILEHRGIAFNEVIVPLAYLGLGRAKALSDDKSGARNAYQDFFALWQHADPDIPVLKEANAEYAKLQ